MNHSLLFGYKDYTSAKAQIVEQIEQINISEKLLNWKINQQKIYKKFKGFFFSLEVSSPVRPTELTVWFWK